MTHRPIDLSFPSTGCWLVQNSPAERVPSHGTTAFASSYAIDLLPVQDDGRTAPFRPATLFRPEPLERFPGYGRPILAPVGGRIVGADDSQPDHDAFRGLSSIAYWATQGRRLRGGWPALSGNHVILDTPDGILVALCHLQCGSISVQPGQMVTPGQPLGRCGDSGNSTQPHLHLQAMDRPDPTAAAPVPLLINGSLPRNGAIVVMSPSGVSDGEERPMTD